MASAYLPPNAIVPDILDDELNDVIKQTVFIAGINLYCYMHKDTALLAYQQPARVHDIIVATFNLPSHGTRLVDEQANHIWDEGNPLHGPNMYSIMMGATQDVRTIIDFLPSSLYPNNEREIIEWGVSGVSLGGHAAWILLAHESRLTNGVIIIGCPRFYQLITDRGQQSIPPVYLPEPFLQIIHDTSAEAVSFSAGDNSNPFFRFSKKIMVISVQDDLLVPWKYSCDYVAAHKFTEPMIEETAQFIATSGRLPVTFRQ